MAVRALSNVEYTGIAGEGPRVTPAYLHGAKSHHELQGAGLFFWFADAGRRADPDLCSKTFAPLAVASRLASGGDCPKVDISYRDPSTPCRITYVRRAVVRAVEQRQFVLSRSIRPLRIFNKQACKPQAPAGKAAGPMHFWRMSRQCYHNAMSLVPPFMA